MSLKLCSNTTGKDDSISQLYCFSVSSTDSGKLIYHTSNSSHGILINIFLYFYYNFTTIIPHELFFTLASSRHTLNSGSFSGLAGHFPH